MKKKIKYIILLLLIPFLLCSCGARKEYNLIELSAKELVENMLGDNPQSFVFALVNDNKTNYQEYMEALKKVPKIAKMNVYYVEYNHIDRASADSLYGFYEVDFSQNGYYVVIDKKLELEGVFSSYSELLMDLKIHSYKSNIKRTEENIITETLEQAKKEYDEGNIAISINTLNQIWNTKEAKQFYEEHPYYNIISSWEHFIYKGKNDETIVYRSMLFYHNEQAFSEIAVTEKREGFKKPTNITDYKEQYFKIKEDILYSASSLNNEYKERFKIIEVNKNVLHIKDLQNNKEYKYSRRT